jgi:hypothetical protein
LKVYKADATLGIESFLSGVWTNKTDQKLCDWQNDHNSVHIVVGDDVEIVLKDGLANYLDFGLTVGTADDASEGDGDTLDAPTGGGIEGDGHVVDNGGLASITVSGFSDDALHEGSERFDVEMKRRLDVEMESR